MQKGQFSVGINVDMTEEMKARIREEPQSNNYLGALRRSHTFPEDTAEEFAAPWKIARL